MKKILLAVLILSFASTVHASMLTNGDFELSATGNGSVFNNTWDGRNWNVWDSLPGWTTANGPGIEVQRSGVVTRSLSGGHHVELDSHGGRDTNTTMYQTVYLTPGDYNLSFGYFARTNNLNDDNGIFAGIADSIDPSNFSSFYGTISKTRRDMGNTWEEINWSFAIADAADYNLTFGAYGLDNSLGGLIDNISLNPSPVPEPATIMLFGIGLLVITGMARKNFYQMSLLQNLKHSII
ncbi:MAG: PEP-CTERM sorting domain-containing protein [Pseudomonadota bacterium]